MQTNTLIPNETQTSSNVDFFTIGYAWTDPILGELESATIVPALDARAAVASLLSKHPHITRAWHILRNVP